MHRFIMHRFIMHRFIMHRFIVIPLWILLPWTLLAFAGPTQAVVTTDRFDFNIELTPADDPAGAYRCRARIVDLRTGETLAAPSVLFLRGTEASLHSQFTIDGEPGGLAVTIGVDAAGETAVYTARLTRGEETLQRQKVSIRLSGEEPRAEMEAIEMEAIEAESGSKTPITMSLKDADLVEVLRTFAKIGEFNIVIDPKISGKVTVELKDVPWDQALEQILKINGLGMEISGGDISILPPR